MRRTATVSLVVVALLVGACGGGDRLTRAEFLKQGNAACKKGNDVVNSAIEKTFPNQNEAPDPAKAKAVFEKTIIPTIQQEIDDIDDLKPPKDLQDDVDKVVDDARAALDTMKKEADQDIEKLLNGDPFEKANKEATAVGLTVCGQS